MHIENASYAVILLVPWEYESIMPLVITKINSRILPVGQNRREIVCLMFLSSVQPKCFFFQNNDLLFNICDVFLHQLWNMDFNCAAVGGKSSHGGRTWLLCFIYPNEKLLVNKGRILLDLAWHTSQTIFTYMSCHAILSAVVLGLVTVHRTRLLRKTLAIYFLPDQNLHLNSSVKGIGPKKNKSLPSCHSKTKQLIVVKSWTSWPLLTVQIHNNSVRNVVHKTSTHDSYKAYVLPAVVNSLMDWQQLHL